MYGPTLGYGWLPRYLGPHPSLYGVPIGRHFPTRWEEYAFAVEALEANPPPLPRQVVDAGTGFNPEIHVLSLILAKADWHVYAIDTNPETLKLPHVPMVQRAVDSLLGLQVPDQCFDAYVCISTLEHLTEADQAQAFQEAARVLKGNGLLAVTADWLPPIMLADFARGAGFDVGYQVPFEGERLDPHVSFLRARKRIGV